MPAQAGLRTLVVAVRTEAYRHRHEVQAGGAPALAAQPLGAQAPDFQVVARRSRLSLTPVLIDEADIHLFGRTGRNSSPLKRVARYSRSLRFPELHFAHNDDSQSVKRRQLYGVCIPAVGNFPSSPGAVTG